MSKIVAWIKANKLSAILILILAYFLLKNVLPSSRRYSLVSEKMSGAINNPSAGGTGISQPYLPYQEAAPAPEVQDRMVIQQSTMSLLVKNVSETQQAINEKIQKVDGYMVNSYITYPQQAETASGNITVRVPQENLKEVLDYFRVLAIKVVSENLSGQDVTDQYVDIDARLATLYKTKIKFEEILGQAVKVEEILQVQRELVNLQEQIDSLKGQQKYLEKNAEMSKITVYLATDELELPYAPSEAWRPAVIFKQAVRTLVKTLRKIGTALIWLGVYAVIWIPALAIYLFLIRRKKKK